MPHTVGDHARAPRMSSLQVLVPADFHSSCYSLLYITLACLLWSSFVPLSHILWCLLLCTRSRLHNTWQVGPESHLLPNMERRRSHGRKTSRIPMDCNSKGPSGTPGPFQKVSKLNFLAFQMSKCPNLPSNNFGTLTMPIGNLSGD